LSKRKKALEILLERINRTVSELPDGSLVTHRKGKLIYYYHTSHTKGKRNTTYISKKDKELISGLANKKYNNNIKEAIFSELSVINRFLTKYDPQAIYAAYDKLPDNIKELVNPYILSDAQFLENWLNTPYEGLNSIPVNNDLITDKGECVRSKSELFIANKLFSMNIPYKYEYPLLLESGAMIYPDFTILDIPRRRDLYLEHFGMMDDPEYCEKALRKIDEYARNGIFLGDKLFLTLESSKTSGYISTFESMIHTITSHAAICQL